jgi:hypothetical protein
LAAGEIIVLLNNDTEVISENWLAEMVQLALLPDVGAVGSKAPYYSNDTIQHAGVVLGFGGGASHLYLGAKESRFWLSSANCRCYGNTLPSPGPAWLCAKPCMRKLAASMKKCCLIGYNDVDFCLKLRQMRPAQSLDACWLFCTITSLFPAALTIPQRKERRFWNELSRLKKRWPHCLDQVIPAYNPNLTLTNTELFLSAPPAGCFAGKPIGLNPSLCQAICRSASCLFASPLAGGQR